MMISSRIRALVRRGVAPYTAVPEVANRGRDLIRGSNPEPGAFTYDRACVPLRSELTVPW